MKKFTLIFSLLTAVATILFTNCRKQEQDLPNKSPFANAGHDTIIGTLSGQAILNAGASFDPDGLIKSYQWKKLSGPDQFNIDDPNKSNTTVRNLIHGKYRFELTVTDNSGNSSSDEMEVIVNKTVKFRILEYGSDKPISTDGISIYAYPYINSSVRNLLSLTSNNNGECIFAAEEFIFGGVDKQGFLGFEATYFGEDTTSTLYLNGYHFADSFVVRLLPKTHITIHIKNDSVKLNQSVTFYTMINFNSQITSNCGDVGNQCAIMLKPNIDTTFSWPMGGNTINQIWVTDNYVFDIGNIYFQDIQFIPKDNNITLEIKY